MRAALLERLVWPGMILAGATLAAIVWAAWPVASAPAAPPTTRPQLASIAPDPSGAGPSPVRSELELSGYEQESPEELGAEPLPGAELTPEPPPVVG